jgi:hypothetical protein
MSSTAIFCAVRTYSAICTFINWIWGPAPKNHSVSYHVLSDDFDNEDLAEMTRVPEDSIYIEEWEKHGAKRCNLFYEGEEIFREFFDPFEHVPEIPWIWIGDKKTEVDLTAAMSKYMVAGNTIRLDLILHLIQVHHDTEIMYVDARTLEEVKFPASGVKIGVRNGASSQAVSDC